MLEHRLKTFVVTGANTGIGYETARALARFDARVIMTARSSEKGEAALEKLRAETGNEKLSLQILDLADLASIKAAAEALRAEERIDCLINNAGLGSSKRGTTKDGFELVMGTNHIGTFAFTESLMPKIQQTAKQRGEARVVNVSSAAHRMAGRLDPENLMPEGAGGWRAYAESKLCNLLHAREMARRYGIHGIRAHAVHPGFVHSEFGRSSNFPGPWQLVFMLTRPMQISPEKGAKTSLAAALSDDGAWNNGLYWEKEKQATPKLPPDPDVVARAVWEETERLLASKGFIIEHEENRDETAFDQEGPAFPGGL